MKLVLFTIMIGMAVAGASHAGDFTNWADPEDRVGDGTGGGDHAGDPSATGVDPGMGTPGAAGGSDGVADTGRGAPDIGPGIPMSPIAQVPLSEPGDRGDEGREPNAFTNWTSPKPKKPVPTNYRPDSLIGGAGQGTAVQCQMWGRVCRDGSAGVRVSPDSCQLRCPEDDVSGGFRDGP